MSTPEEKDVHETALTQFAASGTFTPEVEEVLKWIGKTGCNCYEWEKVLPAVYSKLESVLESDPPAEDMEQFNQDKALALESLKAFTEAPFTLQRLCEFLCDPVMASGRKSKLLWAILKMVCISSTMPREEYLYEKKAPVEDDEAKELMPRTVPLAMPAPDTSEPFNPEASMPKPVEETPAPESTA